MYRPEEPDEEVETTHGTGNWTGEVGQYGEHYEIDLNQGGIVFLHYEDIKPAGHRFKFGSA